MIEEKVERKAPRRLTNVQFFQVCEELRNQREVMTTDRPTLKETAVLLGKKLGFEVSPGTVSDARQVTGIEWVSKADTKRSGSGTKDPVNSASRILANALHKLYMELGVHPPDTLQRLRDYYTTLSRGHQTGTVADIAKDVKEDEPLPKNVAQMVADAQQAIEKTQAQQQNGTTVGLKVFKVGDEVMMDGSPFKRHRITSLKGGGALGRSRQGDGGSRGPAQAGQELGGCRCSGHGGPRSQERSKPMMVFDGFKTVRKAVEFTDEVFRKYGLSCNIYLDPKLAQEMDPVTVKLEGTIVHVDRDGDKTAEADIQGFVKQYGGKFVGT